MPTPQSATVRYTNGGGSVHKPGKPGPKQGKHWDRSQCLPVRISNPLKRRPKSNRQAAPLNRTISATASPEGFSLPETCLQPTRTCKHAIEGLDRPSRQHRFRFPRSRPHSAGPRDPGSASSGGSPRRLIQASTGSDRLSVFSRGPGGTSKHLRWPYGTPAARARQGLTTCGKRESRGKPARICATVLLHATFPAINGLSGNILRRRHRSQPA